MPLALDRLETTPILGTAQSEPTHMTRQHTTDPNASSAKYDSNVHNDDSLTRSLPSLIAAFSLPACAKTNTTTVR